MHKFFDDPKCKKVVESHKGLKFFAGALVTGGFISMSIGILIILVAISESSGPEFFAGASAIGVGVYMCASGYGLLAIRDLVTK